jgi:hypothetical protein
MAMNTISPTSFTTSVLIADTLPNDQLSTMTTVDDEVVSAALEVQSTKGALLLSRLTTAQRNAANFIPTNGMLLYNSTTNNINAYVNDAWEALNIAGGDVVGPNVSVANNITVFADTTGKEIADSGISLFKNDAASLFISNPGYAGGGGVGNTGLGDGIFGALTVGASLTAVGVLALSDVTSAIGSSAFGFESQLRATDGGANSSFGYRSLALNQNGEGNSAFGSRALESTSVGGGSAFGHQALNACTIGLSNTAVGDRAGLVITTGAENSIVGAQALRNSATAAQSCAFGYLSLGNVVNAVNTAALGTQSGTVSVDPAGSVFTGCTFVGANTGTGKVDLANSTAIGSGTQVEADNSINLGTNCNVGINQASPLYTLDIAKVGDTASIRLARAQGGEVPPQPGAGTGYVIYCATDGSLQAVNEAGVTTPIAPAP